MILLAFAQLHELAGFFGGQVLHGELQNVQRRPFALNGLVPFRRGELGAIFGAQFGDGRALFSVAGEFTHAAEGYGAAVMGGELLGVDVIGVNYAEAGLVTGTYGVQLVPGLCTLHVYFAIVVCVADGHGVGIALVAEYGENAMTAALEYSPGLVFRKLLAVPAHFSEHIGTSAKKYRAVHSCIGLTE